MSELEEKINLKEKSDEINGPTKYYIKKAFFYSVEETKKSQI